jgi:hypothetical protein
MRSPKPVFTFEKIRTTSTPTGGTAMPALAAGGVEKVETVIAFPGQIVPIEQNFRPILDFQNFLLAAARGASYP